MRITITICSKCKKRIYGVMTRKMGIIYFDSPKDQSKIHGHKEPWQAVADSRDADTEAKEG